MAALAPPNGGGWTDDSHRQKIGASQQQARAGAECRRISCTNRARGRSNATRAYWKIKLKFECVSVAAAAAYADADADDDDALEQAGLQ